MPSPPKNTDDDKTFDEAVERIEENASTARRGLEEDPGFIGESDEPRFEDSGDIRPDLDDQSAAPG